MTSTQQLTEHQKELKQCSLCSQMHGPPVAGKPVVSPVLLIGQAPGFKEIEVHKPFAWTAGKTLFKWFNEIGLEEDQFRSQVYMSAVCRCFPGKNPKGGDRVPAADEIEQCSRWLNREIDLLQPELIIPVGKLAISQIIEFKKLVEVVGSKHQIKYRNFTTEIIPLPHPSGASTWHRTEPGKSLLNKALKLINIHPAWQAVKKKHI